MTPAASRRAWRISVACIALVVFVVIAISAVNRVVAAALAAN